MAYVVRLRDHGDHSLHCGGTPKHYLTLGQAIHGAKLLAYAKLEAFGKLDTIAAHETMRMIHDASDILQEKVMKSRNVLISNTGYELTIEDNGNAIMQTRR